MEIADKFLPLGTIVKIKNLDREVMISSYCIIPKVDIATKSKPDIREYGGCYYPDGFIRTDRIIAFNHDQIEKVVHMGYETEESKKYSTKCTEYMKKALAMLDTVEDTPEVKIDIKESNPYTEMIEAEKKRLEDESKQNEEES